MTESELRERISKTGDADYAQAAIEDLKKLDEALEAKKESI